MAVKEKYRLSFFDEQHNKLGYLNFVSKTSTGLQYSLNWASNSRKFRSWYYCVVWSMLTNEKIMVLTR